MLVFVKKNCFRYLNPTNSSTMSKKLTIIWALAALLFAIPSSGQGLAEKAFKKQQKLEFSQNFTQKSLKPSKTALLRAVESKKNEFWNLMEENLVGSKSMVNSIFNSAPRSVTTVMSNQSKKSRRAETVDEHGVIIAPAEGVVKYYTRSGIAYYYNNKSEVWASTNQEGHVELVECADGTVYFKNPISYFQSPTNEQ